MNMKTSSSSSYSSSTLLPSSVTNSSHNNINYQSVIYLLRNILTSVVNTFKSIVDNDNDGVDYKHHHQRAFVYTMRGILIQRDGRILWSDFETELTQVFCCSNF